MLLLTLQSVALLRFRLVVQEEQRHEDWNVTQILQFSTLRCMHGSRCPMTTDDEMMKARKSMTTTLTSRKAMQSSA
jgi:hypothetical protein